MNDTKDDNANTYARRAEEARRAASASIDANARTIFLRLAALWDKFAKPIKTIFVPLAVSAVAAAVVWLAPCCMTMHWACTLHFHCDCCAMWM